VGVEVKNEKQHCKTKSNAPRRTNLFTAQLPLPRGRTTSFYFLPPECRSLPSVDSKQWSNLRSCRIYAAFPKYLFLLRDNNCHANAPQCHVYTCFCLSSSLIRIEDTDSHHATVIKRVCVCA